MVLKFTRGALGAPDASVRTVGGRVTAFLTALKEAMVDGERSESGLVRTTRRNVWENGRSSESPAVPIHPGTWNSEVASNLSLPNPIVVDCHLWTSLASLGCTPFHIFVVEIPALWTLTAFKVENLDIIQAGRIFHGVSLETELHIVE